MKLSSTFDLPDEAATRRMAILAMSGAGKSNLAVVMAEEFFDSGIPWVAIDPKGDWYGIRSDASGKRGGLPIPVFGGLHGDVPLEPTAGKLLGELIASKRLTCVIDTSEFVTREEQFRFLYDFAETLLKKNKFPLHIFCEEADEYLPQRISDKGSAPKCLGAWQRLVKRGRQRGIGTTLITQRSASINKDVLNMAECLFAMRVVAPTDRAAILGWVEVNGLGKEIVNALPSLADGEAFVWSPAWLRTSDKHQFRRRRTFDSGRTPEIGQTIEPAKIADIDLAAIKDEIAATMERAKADDPNELRKQIASLQRELADAKKQGDTATLQAELSKLKDEIHTKALVVNEICELARDCEEPLLVSLGGTKRIAKLAHQLKTNSVETSDKSIKPSPVTSPKINEQVMEDIGVAQRIEQRPSKSQVAGSNPAADANLTAKQQQIIDALAWWNSVGVEPNGVQLGAVASMEKTERRKERERQCRSNHEMD